MVAVDILYGTAIGASHTRCGSVNQDAFSIQFTPYGTLLSLADGHGSSLCFRSDIGAKLATSVCYDSLKSVANERQMNDRPEHWLDQWAKAVVKQWAVSVLRHLKFNPFKDDDVDALSQAKRTSLASNALLAYGSTVVSVLIGRRYLYALNLGDGDIVLHRGDDYQLHVLNDAATLGTATYSLATSGCKSKMLQCVKPLDDFQSIMLSSDGYRNSFVGEADFVQVLKDYEAMYRGRTARALQQNFTQWLKETSDQGSGDDITAIVALNRQIKT